MKRILSAVIILFLASCGAKTTLSVSITSWPSGGYNNAYADCAGTYNLNYSKGMFSPASPDPVSVTVKVMWENGSHLNRTEITRKTETVATTGSTPFSYTYSLPGYYLLNYYWYEFSWNDDDGEHTVDSLQGYYY